MISDSDSFTVLAGVTVVVTSGGDRIWPIWETGWAKCCCGNRENGNGHLWCPITCKGFKHLYTFKTYLKQRLLKLLAESQLGSGLSLSRCLSFVYSLPVLSNTVDNALANIYTLPETGTYFQLVSNSSQSDKRMRLVGNRKKWDLDKSSFWTLTSLNPLPDLHESYVKMFIIM